MRDTVRLYQRLWVLACLPPLAVACNTTPAPAPTQANAQPSSAAEVAASTPQKKTKTKPKTKPRGPRINKLAPATSPPKLSPEQQRLAPRAGDPPFIDGYNPEEDRCESGNWCGNVTTAMAVAPDPDIPKEMDCPTRIVGRHGDTSPVKGRAYKGLSDKNNMQGAFNQHGSELARADGQAEACCYHWFDYCSGRPLVDEGIARVAPTTRDSAWMGDSATGPTPVDPDLRQALAQAWLVDAQAEHASVAAFGRVVLELMALAAPAHLVDANLEAARDEVQHAKVCFALATRFGGRPYGPGPLPAVAPRKLDLVGLAVSTFVEGCLGETTAALVAERSAAQTNDPQIAAVLERIAGDEARHAAIAWRIVTWTLRCEPSRAAAVGHALRDALDACCQQTPQTTKTPQDPDWQRFGRLSATQQAQAQLDARNEIVRPMLERLLQS